MKPRLAEKRDPSQLPQFFHFDHFTGARISPKAKLFLPKIFAIGMIALFPCIVMAIFKLHVLTSAALSVRIVSFKVQSQSIAEALKEKRMTIILTAKQYGNGFEECTYTCCMPRTIGNEEAVRLPFISAHKCT